MMLRLLLSRFQLLLLGLLAWGAGHPPASHGQNISRADSLASHAPVVPPAAASAAPVLPPQLVTQEQYDARRLARVVVVWVGKPAQSDSLLSNPKVFLSTHSAPKASFHLNDEVLLYVKDLRLALRRSKRPKTDLRLYIDNIVLPMEPIQVDTIHQRDLALVRFKLVRNAETEATWQIFYHLPDKLEDEKARFNIGFPDGQLGQAYAQNLTLLLVNSQWFWGGLLVLLPGLVLLFVLLALNSNFIRSDLSGLIPLDETSRKPWGLDRRYSLVPYSLAKSQIAFWTLLTISGYVMIALVTTALPTIPTGLLGLIGISVANGVLSKIITQPTPADTATPPARKQVIDNIGPSRGWLYDVLNDATGVNLSRLQFLLFNLIAGGYLVYFVWTNWSLPTFDSGLLALISISSAGFLANKSTTSSAKTTSPLTATGGDGNMDTSSSDGNDPAPAGGDAAAPATGDSAPATSPTAGTTPTDNAPSPAPDSTAAPAPPATGSEAATADPASPAPAEQLVAQAPMLLAPPQAAPAAIPPAPAPSLSPLQDWQQRLARFRDSPVIYDSDPTRAIFGARPSAAPGRQLQVTILDTLKAGLTLQAVLTCDPAMPLPKNVIFLLHPTYEQRVVSAAVDKLGQATLCFFSAGCFTLLAMTDEGRTVLAFDLSTVPGAPSSFLSR